MTTPYRSDSIPNSTFYRILSGFHRTFATGVACRQGTLTPPDTWSRPFGTCICSTCWDQSFSELVVILPDYAFRISLGTFSILPFNNSKTPGLLIMKWGSSLRPMSCLNPRPHFVISIVPNRFFFYEENSFKLDSLEKSYDRNYIRKWHKHPCSRKNSHCHSMSMYDTTNTTCIHIIYIFYWGSTFK